MAKVNVSLPDELLAEVDALAEELKRSRSGLVREATAKYVADINAEQERQERYERIGEAMKDARRIAKKVGYFDPVPVIRADRERDTPEELRREREKDGW